MPDEIKRIDYYYASVPDKPGEGARIRWDGAGPRVLSLKPLVFSLRSGGRSG